MKKTKLISPIIFLLVLCSFGLVPVASQSLDYGWANLPISDPNGDIWEHTEMDEPWDGKKGDYRPDIDIKYISLIGDYFTMEFWGTPTLTATYFISIDTNNSGTENYALFRTTAPSFYLRDQSNLHYWNGTGWQVDAIVIPTAIVSNNVTAQLVNNPIPTIASANISAWVRTSGYPIYSDFAPLDPTGPSGIPGFLVVNTFFGLLVLFGIALFRRWQQNSI